MSIAYGKQVWIGKSFYFLISENSNHEAVSNIIQLDGGAGYPWMDGEEIYTVYSVYLTDKDLQAIQAGIHEETQLIKKEIGYLFFQGKDKNSANVYCGALYNLYNIVDVISQAISKLERGATQQACKRILGILESQLAYMVSTYSRQYPVFSNVCASLQKGIRALLEETVFCKDMRYLLCEACISYIELAEDFTL